MVGNKIFIMIKFDVVKVGYIGVIFVKINEVGFCIVVMKLIKFFIEKVGEFYEVYKECFFYGEFVDFMFFGLIVVVVLEKDNVVEDFCMLIGVINLVEVVFGIICVLFVKSIGENVVYGVDFDENVVWEVSFYFVVMEMF